MRVYTFFIYLNDVPAGGETAFGRLGLKVRPKKGAAILWPSVQNAAPNETDHGTYHEAMPVLEGIKLGANVWVHMHDFRSVSAKHCLFTMKNVRAARARADSCARREYRPFSHASERLRACPRAATYPSLLTRVRTAPMRACSGRALSLQTEE